MTSQRDVMRRFHAAVPQVREWIDDYLANHASQARSVASYGFERLALCYPEVLLERTKVVEVERVPFPPIERFGLPELAHMQQMQAAGVTFKDTYILQRGASSESLHFHELVHVVQWATLGVDNFLLAYGMGLMQSGYRQSPLEQMAYALQAEFEGGKNRTNLVQAIEQQTDAVWKRAQAAVQRGIQ